MTADQRKRAAAELGRVGGRHTAARHGREYFQRIGHAGGRAGAAALAERVRRAWAAYRLHERGELVRPGHLRACLDLECSGECVIP